NDHEFFPPVARADVKDPNACAKEVRDVPQNPITLEMASGIVDPLEVIDVDEQQREILPLAPRALDFRLESSFKVATIEQARDRIDGSELRELRQPVVQTLATKRRRGTGYHDAGGREVACIKPPPIQTIGQSNDSKPLIAGDDRQYHVGIGAISKTPASIVARFANDCFSRLVGRPDQALTGPNTK